jgi:4-hydroxythreonine-4-phosphate dehydrogenase
MLPVLEPEGAEQYSPAYGQISAIAGAIAGRGIVRGVDACLHGRTKALITAPSCKEALHLAGFGYPGQTEMIATLAGSVRYLMILAVDALKIGMATTHVALRDVPKVIQPELIAEKIGVLADTLAARWGIPNPKIAVAALNPHASDGGIFGDEEEKIIAPAILAARQAGRDVAGPFPADTVFVTHQQFDGILAMYHDQGMIPIKLTGFGQAINTTGGLPFPRTSPDHGTAFDIAGHMRADHHSMLKAIEAAATFVDRDTSTI